MFIRKDKESLEKELKDKRVVVVTGAGISTLSNIPDYMTMDGMIASDGLYYEARQILSLNFIERFRKDFDKWFNEKFSNEYKPNKVHNWIKSLEDITEDLTVITQNIDNLHNNITNLIEFHGNAYKRDVNNLPNVVFYGKQIDKNNFELAKKKLLMSDVILIMGTNLEVEPLSSLVLSCVNSDSYWLNNTVPEFYYFHQDINFIQIDFKEYF